LEFRRVLFPSRMPRQRPRDFALSSTGSACSPSVTTSSPASDPSFIAGLLQCSEPAAALVGVPVLRGVLYALQQLLDVDIENPGELDQLVQPEGAMPPNSVAEGCPVHPHLAGRPGLTPPPFRQRHRDISLQFHFHSLCHAPILRRAQSLLVRTMHLAGVVLHCVKCFQSICRVLRLSTDKLGLPD